MNKLTCILVDDEELARSALKHLIQKINAVEVTFDVEIVDECENSRQAIESIEMFKPDLVFLDINMPNQSGLEMLKKSKIEPFPFVVFVTAYSKYAVQGFEAEAVDYLLKPVSLSRLNQSIQRVIKHHNAKLNLQSMVVKDGLRKVKIHLKDIELIEAAGNYMCIKTNKETLVQRITMQELQMKLTQEFYKVNRSTIINANSILEIESIGQSRYKIIMSCGEEVITSNYYRNQLAEISKVHFTPNN